MKISAVNIDISGEEDAIAVIGMAGRFPGAKNLVEFWTNLKEGKDSIRRFTDEELKQAGVSDSLIRNPRYVKARGILDHIEQFDAGFFSITPYEATIMDPQHRVFLELCWEGLETVGYSTARQDTFIGVFAGMSDNTYLEHQLLKNKDFLEDYSAYQTQIANSSHFLATKISYYLNLKGPSLNINTACSTSLVTIIKACQSLILGECDLALAGGVSIRIPQIRGYLYQEEGIFSESGQCRAFDAKATGTVSANAAGVVVLKRLKEALRDRDTISAIIRSHAINNDGAMKAGYTAPSVLEQSRCIAMALAKVDPESISYIETHGTGTFLGDPIEIAALTKAFRHYTQKRNYCAIGSVKTNIGHADAAAGVVGFIKTVLALKNKIIPASLYFENPNPKISFHDSPFYVNKETTFWSANVVRRAGVSSFGVGGTNAHVILEEAPPKKPAHSFRAAKIISLSAKTSSALRMQQENLLNYFDQKTDRPDLADIAYTLQVGRREFTYRQSFVCTDVNQLILQLRQNLDTSPVENLEDTLKKPKLVFLFSGQGTLFPGAAKEIYFTEPRFRRYVEECCTYLESSQQQKVFDYITNDHANFNEAFTLAFVQQPALFIIEYSLAKTLIDWGIVPQAMLGHSLGEYVALCLAGVLFLSDAIRLISIRGKLMDQIPPGSMLAVPMRWKELSEKLRGFNISLAAVNAPQWCVISGIPEVIQPVQKILDNELKEENKKCILLKVQHAFHSYMMDPILDEYKRALLTISFHSVKIPVISNVTGKWLTSLDIDSNYLVNHLRNPVLFSQGLILLNQEGYDTYLEIGVGQGLLGFARQHHFKGNLNLIKSLPSEQEYLRDPATQANSLQQILSTCWLLNVPVNWAQYYNDEERYRLPLPTYPFERKKYWIESDNSAIEIVSEPILYEYYWELSNLSVTFDLSEPKKWLIFADSFGMSEKLLHILIKHKQKVVCVTPGEHFEKVGTNDYQINPLTKANYSELFSVLYNENQLPDHFIYCWSLSDKNMISFVDACHVINNDFLQLTYFSQTFLNQSSLTHLSMTVIANNSVKVLKGDALVSEKTTLLGVSKVIPQEYPGVNCRVVDVNLLDLEEIDAENLIKESNCTTNDALIAYRSGIRLVKKIKSFEAPSSIERSLFKYQGIYLIIGGTGHIGLELARFLSKNYAAHLWLISRFSHSPEMESEINEIKKFSSSTHLIQADVTDVGQMKALFEEIKTIHGKLDGLFYLAGTINTSTYTLIEQMTFEKILEQFMPKIRGLQIIQSLMSHLSIDFCILFSSIATLLGGVGLASYAAANCYLDAVAEQNRNNQSHWISINWDAWQFSQTEQDNVINDRNKFSLPKLQPRKAIEVLDNNLNSLLKSSNIAIALGRLNERIKSWINPTVHQIQSSAEGDLSKISGKLQLSPREEKSAEEKLKDIFFRCLGVRDIRPEDKFYNLGGDSLTAIRLIEMIQNTFSVRIKLSDLVTHDVSSLADFIEKFPISRSKFCIVHLKKSGDRAPLFFIHPVSGMIFCYLDLIRCLPEGRPCYGIQDPTAESNHQPFTSLEDMASAYLQEIRSIQPQGPYWIVGYSFGANVAFEIVRQLEDGGETVKNVFLIDGWALFSRELKSHEKFQESMQYVLAEMDGNIPSSFLNKEHFLTSAWRRMQLLLHYQPQKIRTPIVLFKAKEILLEYRDIDETTNHWDKYSTGGVRVYLSNGDHRTILKSENALQVSSVMGKFLENSL